MRFLEERLILTMMAFVLTMMGRVHAVYSTRLAWDSGTLTMMAFGLTMMGRVHAVYSTKLAWDWRTDGDTYDDGDGPPEFFLV